MTPTTDAVQQLADATQQRAELAASLPDLTQAADQAAANRRQLAARLERQEGDTLIGVVDDAALAKTRAKCDAAVLDDRKATARLRHVQQALAALDADIARLTPEAQTLRLTFYRDEQLRLVTLMREAFEAQRAINEQLHDLYLAADTEFPRVTVRGGGNPHPPAAGLTDLSWHELRHNPHAANGGRLGSWLKAVDELVNPPSPVPSRRAPRAAAPAKAKADGPWRALPQEAR